MWQGEVPFLCPSLFFHLFYPRGSMTVKLGAQMRTVCDGLDFQSNIYNTLFISLPLGKRSGFWLNSMSGSRRNKVRLGLQAPWATACF